MQEEKRKLLEYMKSQRLMALLTHSQKPWASLVYYVVDDEFNLFFLSQPDTRHCKDIYNNPAVACAIADSRQKVTDKKIGIQIEGTATIVNDPNKIKLILEMWNKANPGIENIINFENMQNKNINSRIYKIRPRLVKFFNEELYGSEGFKIFEF